MTKDELLTITPNVVAELTDSEYRNLVDTIKAGRSLMAASKVGNFFIGQTVTFKGRRGIELMGRIVKINPTTIKIDCGEWGLWRVHPSFVKG